MAPGALSESSAPSSPAQARILVPEKVSPDGLALLTGDFDVDVRVGLKPDELMKIIPEYQGLIVRSETKVTSAVLQAGRNLRVVARAGVGVDNIDVDAATSNGVIVVNSPAGNIVAAAEHTVALLLATARNIGRADGGSKAGKWERGKLVGVEVGRKTLGIIGLGKVGMKVARMCVGLGMDVAAVDPYASAEVARAAGVELVPRLEDLLPRVDFLTIHTPLIASTLDLLGEAELRAMKRTARVLNVARGGVYNEEALLRALDEGWIAGAGLDVFTAEPPAPDSAAARLARHEKVVATPHLGASTVEAQENVSLDVCTQVRTILRGGLPTAAVNAPLILPEEYRKLQPFVRLVEKMGGLYTQHYASLRAPSSHRFELVYQGDLASVSNTRPLFAALVKGLVSAISDSGGRDVNIVNATLIAEEKGIVISEVHSRQPRESGDGATAYASLVTLRALDGGGGGREEKQGGAAAGKESGQVIEGYVSGNSVYISRLGRFTASFTPEGTLLILHNYDEPGKIGGVGNVLGRYGINIRFMQVASLDKAADGEGKGGELELTRLDSAVSGVGGEGGQEKNDGGNESSKVIGDEALMILGVDGEVTRDVREDLEKAEGILHVSLVRL
ncbi:phosphoglycerate dehydrogenase [Xylariaceae sp. FL0016]|nr:phosphoglycerate dehydrogenase [Xylariaceae sp. FL0016]